MSSEATEHLQGRHRPLGHISARVRREEGHGSTRSVSEYLLRTQVRRGQYAGAHAPGDARLVARNTVRLRISTEFPSMQRAMDIAP